MKPFMKLLNWSAVAASFLLLQPLQAQAPAQPAAGSAAAADAADIQQQAADAFARAVSAAARCDREELARQLAILERLNARIAEVKAAAAAGAKAARRVPQGFGGAPEGGGDSVARAESAVGQLLAHARNLVPACPPGATATAPPAEDIPTLEAGPAPPEFLDGYEGKGTISAPYPLDPEERLLREYGNMPLPPENGAAESEAPEKGGAEGAGGAAPPEKMEPAPPKEQAAGPSNQPSEAKASLSTTGDWPSKARASDLKADTSETIVEQMEAPPSSMELCENRDASKAECDKQQPPRRGRKPRE